MEPWESRKLWIQVYIIIFNKMLILDVFVAFYKRSFLLLPPVGCNSCFFANHVLDDIVSGNYLQNFLLFLNKIFPASIQCKSKHNPALPIYRFWIISIYWKIIKIKNFWDYRVSFECPVAERLLRQASVWQLRVQFLSSRKKIICPDAGVIYTAQRERIMYLS